MSSFGGPATPRAQMFSLDDWALSSPGSVSTAATGRNEPPMTPEEQEIANAFSMFDQFKTVTPVKSTVGMTPSKERRGGAGEGLTQEAEQKEMERLEAEKRRAEREMQAELQRQRDAQERDRARAQEEARMQQERDRVEHEKKVEAERERLLALEEQRRRERADEERKQREDKERREREEEEEQRRRTADEEHHAALRAAGTSRPSLPPSPSSSPSGAGRSGSPSLRPTGAEEAATEQDQVNWVEAERRQEEESRRRMQEGRRHRLAAEGEEQRQREQQALDRESSASSRPGEPVEAKATGWIKSSPLWGGTKPPTPRSSPLPDAQQQAVHNVNAKSAVTQPTFAPIAPARDTHAWSNGRGQVQEERRVSPVPSLKLSSVGIQSSSSASTSPLPTGSDQPRVFDTPAGLQRSTTPRSMFPRPTSSPGTPRGTVLWMNGGGGDAADRRTVTPGSGMIEAGPYAPARSSPLQANQEGLAGQVVRLEEVVRQHALALKELRQSVRNLEEGAGGSAVLVAAAAVAGALLAVVLVRQRG